MEIVGSNINTSLPGINEMLDNRDEKALLELCRQQIEWGAHRIALNCGTRIGTEMEDMAWMVKAVASKFDIPLMVDSPNPLAIEAALENNRHGRMLVDSITCERGRIEAVMPLVKKHDALVVCLLQSEAGMPETIGDRLKLMPVVEEVAGTYGMKKQDMLLDSLLFPLAMDDQNGMLYMNCLRALKAAYPDYSYSCGLNNISYGMPETELLSIGFTSMLFALGQEYLFMELYRPSQAFLRANMALAGQDENTMDYIEAYRDGRLAIFN